MKEFMLLFRNVSGDGQYVSTPQDMQEDLPNWQAWIGGLASRGQLIDTRPIEYAGRVVSNTGVRESPYKTENFLVAGYLICQATTLEEITDYAGACPILKYPQGSVEIRSIMPFEI
ncbi:YciI family protein [Spirosoma aerolatum]|uniref:YciI family protein n=1 Tax=Spirosoma aerolatum TaxID=1211326 RepID=UPI0009AE8FE7|nr:YciI family protein [Spirosoma aerolatum]